LPAIPAFPVKSPYQILSGVQSETVSTDAGGGQMRRRYVLVAVVAGAGIGLAGGLVGGPAVAAEDAAVVHTGGTVLNVRTGPGISTDRLGSVRRGTRLGIACQAQGQRIHGAVSTTSRWDLLTTGGYVSHAYVSGGATVPACPTATPTDPAQYVAAVAPLARTWARYSGIPASVTVAQAILESGWGGSKLARDGNSQFGIKCFDGPGAVAVGCRSYPTTECAGSACHPAVASFRRYLSIADSFRDHDRFLRLNSRYALALQTRDPDLFAARLQQAGYATDPGYAAKLIQLMHTADLYRFDR
jgi:flagellar protein FlgJ